MAKDYQAMATQIVDYVGGGDNVKHVMHCATRLRFTLNDLDAATKNTDAIKAIPGVVDVIVQNGQYQVCIGPDVSNVFKVVEGMLPKTSDASGDVASEGGKKKWSDRFFEVVSGIFTPVVPVLMASGMMGAILTILNLVGVLPEDSPTYYVLNIIYDAGFYFLPIFIAYNAARKLDVTPLLAMLLGAIMLHPNLSAFDSLGVEQLSVFGIGIPTVAYSKTVLPIILGVWLMHWENGDRHYFPTRDRGQVPCSRLQMPGHREALEGDARLIRVDTALTRGDANLLLDRVDAVEVGQQQAASSTARAHDDAVSLGSSSSGPEMRSGAESTSTS